VCGSAGHLERTCGIDVHRQSQISLVRQAPGRCSVTTVGSVCTISCSARAAVQLVLKSFRCYKSLLELQYQRHACGSQYASYCTVCVPEYTTCKRNIVSACLAISLTLHDAAMYCNTFYYISTHLLSNSLTQPTLTRSRRNFKQLNLLACHKSLMTSELNCMTSPASSVMPMRSTRSREACLSHSEWCILHTSLKDHKY
jgi:hypothetical protein